MHRFDARLESLRGIAALAVVLTHGVGAFSIDGSPAFWAESPGVETPSQLALTILTAVFNAGAAVVLFFVLSGHVLALSLTRSNAPLMDRLLPYFVRRAFRLLPAMWISILAVSLVRLTVADAVPGDMASDWYKAVFGSLISYLSNLQNFFLTNFSVNPNTWTMSIEIICSIFVPILCVLSDKGKIFSASILIVLIILAWEGPVSGMVLRYMFCFQIGIMLALHGDLTRWITRPRLLIGFGLLIFMAQRLALLYDIRGTMLQAVGATAILSAVTSPSGRSCLHSLDVSPMRMLGRISYSFYLLHLAVLYVLAQIIARSALAPFGYAVPQIALAMATIVVSLPLAWACYHAVERPAIALGRGLSDRMVRARAKDLRPHDLTLSEWAPSGERAA